MIFITLFFNHNYLNSQILKFSGGTNSTWMDGKQFDTPCLTYTGSIGYDYLLDRDYHDWYYLSSEIGYVKKGRKDVASGEKLEMDYLHINILFKMKYSFENLMLSAGIGPSVDYQLIIGGQDKKFVWGNKTGDKLILFSKQQGEPSFYRSLSENFIWNKEYAAN